MRFVLTVWFFVLALYSQAVAGKVIAMGNPDAGAAPVTAGINACFKGASKKFNIPLALLKAIAVTESSMNPYALGIKGRSYYPKTYREALLLMRRYRGARMDIGIMQINTINFKRYGIPLERGLNPCFSIYFGAFILKRLIHRYGFNWFAIASYNSSSKKANLRYAWKVYKNLKEEIRHADGSQEGIQKVSSNRRY